MLITSKIIVLSKLKYRDNDLIVKCYTAHRGVVSYILRGVLKSKKGKTKSVYFQLLSQLNIEEKYRPNQALQTLNNVKLDIIYASLHTNIYKSAIVMFLSEVLNSALREEERNDELFNYLETSLQFFDSSDGFANFHLLFLLKLTRYLGFYPDTDNIDKPFFNLETGTFETSGGSINTIQGENLTLLKQLLGINFDVINGVKMNSKQRHSFLNMLLYYFELHLDGFKKPKSLQVLNDVFH